VRLTDDFKLVARLGSLPLATDERLVMQQVGVVELCRLAHGDSSDVSSPHTLKGSSYLDAEPMVICLFRSLQSTSVVR
jgi:hypothetical protein